MKNIEIGSIVQYADYWYRVSKLTKNMANLTMVYGAVSHKGVDRSLLIEASNGWKKWEAFRDSMPTVIDNTTWNLNPYRDLVSAFYTQMTGLENFEQGVTPNSFVDQNFNQFMAFVKKSFLQLG